MACCNWDTFNEGFVFAWRHKGVGELLIDWKQAKKDWKRYHCTGGEAASVQLRFLAQEGTYLWLERFNEGKGGDYGGGGVTIHPIPKPLHPLPA
jgi:hypothetical protein